MTSCLVLQLHPFKVASMKTQTIQLSNVLNDQASRDLSALLLRIPGVDAALCAPGGGKISVSFDEDRTSGLEIEAAVARAGFTLAPGGARTPHTSCCGGCGGAGH